MDKQNTSTSYLQALNISQDQDIYNSTHYFRSDLPAS